MLRTSWLYAKPVTLVSLPRAATDGERDIERGIVYILVRCLKAIHFSWSLPVGVSKSLKQKTLDSGVGLRVEKRGFKRWNSPGAQGV